MIRQRAIGLRAFLVLCDALLAGAVFAVVAWVPLGTEAKSYWSGLIQPVELFALTYALVWVAALALSGLYQPRIQSSLRAETAGILKTAAWVALGTAAFLFFARLPNSSRIFFLVLFSTQAAVTVLAHAVSFLVLRRLQASDRNARGVVVIGAGESGRAFAQWTTDRPWLGLRVVGFLDADSRLAAGLPERWAYLGGLEELPRLLHELVIADVAVCVPPTSWDERIDGIVRLAQDEGKTVHIGLGLSRRPAAHGQFEAFDGMSMYSVMAGPGRCIGISAKRLMDVVGASLGLLLLSPILAGVALAIVLTDGRPVFFMQERIGLHGRRFRMIKFRTMVCGAEAMLPDVLKLNQIVGPGFQLDNDPRVTKLGRFLRKSSLDELPQLWNVLLGDMSIVGPRPAPMTEVSKYEHWHRRRLSAKPGITGLAQIEARSYREFDQKANLDLQYIDRWSTWLDVRIIIRTLGVLIWANGR
jgi:exopolysaccharide biosynthesis polyprenyl glycosylphosphotransferase